MGLLRWIRLFFAPRRRDTHDWGRPKRVSRMAGPVVTCRKCGRSRILGTDPVLPDDVDCDFVMVRNVMDS